jgi:hypothetical protein
MRWHQKGPAATPGLLIFPHFAGISLAAKEGFEPSLTADPELRLGCSGPY